MTALALLALLVALVVAANRFTRPPSATPVPPGRDTTADGLGELLDPGIFARLMPEEPR